jgi:hypothetical protein
MSETASSNEEEYDVMEAFRAYRESRSERNPNRRPYEPLRVGGWMTTNTEYRQEANYEYAGQR